MRRRKSKEARSPTARVLLRPYIRAQRWRLIWLSASAIGGGFAEAAVHVLVARVAFALASENSNVELDLGPFATQGFSIGLSLSVAAALVVVRTILQAVSTALGARATNAVVESTRTKLIDGYLAAGWPLQSVQRDGRLQELLTTYTNSSATAISAVAQGSTNFFNFLALLATAFFVNPIASIAAGFTAVLLGFALRPLRGVVRRWSARAASSNLDFATGITELTSTLQEVRIFGVERPVASRLDGLNRTNVRLSLRTAYASGAVAVVYQGLALLLLIGALGLAQTTSFSELSTLGAIVLIVLRSLSYAQAVQTSLQGVSLYAPYIEALDAESAKYRASIAPHGTLDVPRICSVVFDDVSFEYEPGVPVLQHISFTAGRGETIGIVGPSGSGKSTLIQLLLRLREPTSGAIYAEQVDVRQFKPASWFKHVSLVPQDTHLLSGTVRENIRFFRDDVDDDAIERAAQLAHLHDDIVSWPRGYDTEIGVRGSQLSGGQRQRLCIARALVEEPDVLILDEPTSALDVRSEALIRDTLASLSKTSMVFVIAHRVSTLAICDRIMVIMAGALEGIDSPTALAESNEFYREALRLSGMLR
jgi:ABC-type multidrug transport system fused ATPase/permease subunit